MICLFHFCRDRSDRHWVWCVQSRRKGGRQRQQDLWKSCQMTDPKISKSGDFCPHRFSKFLSAQYIRHIHRRYSIFFTAQGPQSRKHVRVSSICWSSSSVSISASSSPFFFFPTNAIITFLISAWRLQCFEYVVVFSRGVHQQLQAYGVGRGGGRQGLIQIKNICQIFRHI